ncbi:glycosyl hydrolase [Actinocrispum sp. NPDC049592]|uniref:glycosyl hydrolase n=1 Tax=Actinocrispum sp. NPDC049592 TaxID=3154835 RepID=UPI00341FE409
MTPLSRRAALLGLAGIALAGCSSPPPPPAPPLTVRHTPPNGPADRSATPDTRRLLAWITALPQRSSRRLVSGQQITADAVEDYEHLFNGLARTTGHKPALIGVSYDGYWNARIVPVLISHWQSGGLVTIDMHPPNPFVSGADPESYRVDAATPKPDLRMLLSGDSAPRSRWLTWLNRVADVIAELADAGVVVIFRPLHEANGLWFWWGADTHTGASAAVDLYRDLYSFMTETRNLHNILWAYSPARPWNAPRMEFYPGDDVVDIMGPTLYGNELTFGLENQQEDISDILEPHRPLALLEMGSGMPYDGTWDLAKVITRIKTSYPAVTMFNCWHGWMNTKMSLAEVTNAATLMNDPWTITTETTDWHPQPK